MRTFAVVALSVAALAAPALAQTAPQQPPQPPAVESLNRQQLRDEVTRLRAIVGSGAVRPQRPGGCTTPEHRQFDFWVGEWDVSPTGNAAVVVAESTISMHDQGCVIMEYWRPFRGAHGHSLNMYDTADQKWHQTWMAASGLRSEYAGTFQNGGLYLDALTPLPGTTPANARVRMNYQAIDANTVRQWGDQYDEATQTWNVTWDLTYRRRANTRH
jgi:hypothetical protein